MKDPDKPTLHLDLLEAPPDGEKAASIRLVKGPNIESLPECTPLPDGLEIPVLLKVKDNLSTDEIMPAGSRVLPYRSNIPVISQFLFESVDSQYVERAGRLKEEDESGHAIMGGHNYGQGSSREHAALAPRFLGLQIVLAKSFSRIHWQNLVNFGVLPLEFVEEDDCDALDRDDVLRLEEIHSQVSAGRGISVHRAQDDTVFRTRHRLSARQAAVL